MPRLMTRRLDKVEEEAKVAVPRKIRRQELKDEGLHKAQLGSRLGAKLPPGSRLRGAPAQARGDAPAC